MRAAWRIIAAVILLGSSTSAWAQAERTLEIVLRKNFIEKYKNRVTLSTNAFMVDKVHKHVNPAAKDGDIHVAGRSKDIGLPTVAEVMNAAEDTPGVDLLHQVEGSGSVSLTGVWRLWAEHGGLGRQVQGAPLAPFQTTNPPHVFEVHPILRLNEEDLIRTLHPINGFEPKDAYDAFHSYENLRSQIVDRGQTVSIFTGMGGYNYVEFCLMPLEKLNAVSDGSMLLANVADLKGELIVHRRRMVFPKASPAEVVAGQSAAGLHVLGIPRVDLALVSWRLSNAKAKPEILRWNLPYEIVVVALYPDDSCAGNQQ